jgi:hypothetical protein
MFVSRRFAAGLCASLTVFCWTPTYLEARPTTPPASIASLSHASVGKLIQNKWDNALALAELEQMVEGW